MLGGGGAQVMPGHSSSYPKTGNWYRPIIQMCHVTPSVTCVAMFFSRDKGGQIPPKIWDEL